MADDGFSAKIKIKRKRLPSSPIHVKVQAMKEGDLDSDQSPLESSILKRSLPTTKRMRSNIRTPHGMRGEYK